jgi:hypothetical protein
MATKAFSKSALKNDQRVVGRPTPDEDLDAVLAERAATKENEIALIRDRLGTSASGLVTRAADVLVEARGAKLQGDDWTSFRDSVSLAARFETLDEQLSKMQKRFSSQAKVVKEPRVYSSKSPNSFYRDVALIASPGVDFATRQRAEQNLERYGAELDAAVRDRTREGKRALRCLRERGRRAVPENQVVRPGMPESRALSTGGGATATATSGASSFVPPYWAFKETVLWRGIHRTVADQCQSLPLPPAGMSVILPSFSSTDSTSLQTEGAAVAELDPSTGLPAGTLVTATGQLTLSQQGFDRAGGSGGQFDLACQRQLQQQLDESIEKYVVGQIINSAAAVAGQAAFTVAGLYTDLAKGREVLTDTAGTRLRPTCLFTTSDLYSYVSRQVDSSGRPIVTPQWAPGYPIEAGDSPAKWSRFTGHVMPGSVLWYTADAIPASSSNTQLIISSPDESVALFEGEPILSVFPETAASSLEVLLNLRAYVLAVIRYPNGSAVITGNAYPTSAV